ncbi:hypothetical protein FACS189425_06140 [Clostridia bacterium]|nr:hypothetical protein FACS189425_06140 [Clostridia bacterium]
MSKYENKDVQYYLDKNKALMTMLLEATNTAAGKLEDKSVITYEQLTSYRAAMEAGDKFWLEVAEDFGTMNPARFAELKRRMTKLHELTNIGCAEAFGQDAETAARKAKMVGLEKEVLDLAGTKDIKAVNEAFHTKTAAVQKMLNSFMNNVPVGSAVSLNPLAFKLKAIASKLIEMSKAEEKSLGVARSDAKFLRDRQPYMALKKECDALQIDIARKYVELGYETRALGYEAYSWYKKIIDDGERAARASNALAEYGYLAVYGRETERLAKNKTQELEHELDNLRTELTNSVTPVVVRGFTRLSVLNPPWKYPGAWSPRAEKVQTRDEKKQAREAIEKAKIQAGRRKYL